MGEFNGKVDERNIKEAIDANKPSRFGGGRGAF
jgi:hypothetical protein